MYYISHCIAYLFLEKKYSNLQKFDILNELENGANPRVKNLASAILQLEQSIERHYLKAPLGNYLNLILNLTIIFLLFHNY